MSQFNTAILLLYFMFCVGESVVLPAFLHFLTSTDIENAAE